MENANLPPYEIASEIASQVSFPPGKLFGQRGLYEGPSQGIKNDKTRLTNDLSLIKAAPSSRVLLLLARLQIRAIVIGSRPRIWAAKEIRAD